MNVHKRCQKNVPNNCGINTKQMAEVLQQIGISPDPDKQTPRRSKYMNQVTQAPSSAGSSASDSTGSTHLSEHLSATGHNTDIHSKHRHDPQDNGKTFKSFITVSNNLTVFFPNRQVHFSFITNLMASNYGF